jgi:hypothetical protein
MPEGSGMALKDVSDDDLVDSLRKQVAAWFSNVHLLEFEELIRRFNKAKEKTSG